MQLLFIGDFLSEVFVGIIMVLDTVIYGLISSAYKIFMAIASARLLSSDVYYDIASRIYIVIGVLMLFVLSYAILKAIVDPDQATKGDLGPGMIKRVIIAVLGLAITPVLFNVLYQAQGLFLEQDVLGKVFFRIQNTENIEVNGVSGNPDEQIKNIGGAVAATSIWQAFFHPAEGYNSVDIKSDASEYVGKAIGTAIACGLGIAAGLIITFGSWGAGTVLGVGAAVALCSSSIAGDITQADQIAAQGGDVTLEQAYAIAAGGGSFDIFLIFIDNYVEDDEIEYFWGVSTLCGAFALYAFASFSIDMGVRAAKLAYYQIIAPVPLVMQVLPKYKDTFSKYIKNVVSTFLEVFIRISVVYIVVYVVCHLQDLFSSFGSLWGSESLNLAEKSLALAFLILGLVIFAKSAPDIICQSLNIEKGSMKLGIGKKLADGGAFAAGAIGHAGVSSAVQNFRNTKGWKKGFSALGGLGSGAARAAFNQFGPGPNRKPAMTWNDMKNVSKRAAQESADKRDRRDDRQEAFASAKEAMNAAKADYNEALADFNAATNDADRAAAQKRMQAAQEAKEAARKRMNEATAIGAALDNVGKKLDAWSVGTVSTEKEEAAMKFGSDLDGLKGKLRDEAYKKDATARRLYTAYNNLKNEPINEYAEGWDEQSANAEFRRRRALIDSDPATSSAITAMHAKRDDLQSLVNSGVTSGAAYDAAVRDLAASKTALETVLASHGISKKTITADGTFQMMGDIKIDAAEARRQRDDELEGLRNAMEAAADAFVHSKASDATSNTYKDIATFLSDHAAYIGQNGSMQVTVGYELDSSGNPDYTKPITEALGKVLEDSFGKSAQQGKFVPDADFKKQTGIKIEVSNPVSQDGHQYSEVVYKLSADGTEYEPYGVDASTGTETRLRDSESYDKKTFFDTVAENITKGVFKKASSDTAVSRASDKGKTSATYIRNNEYAEKISRKRQAEEGKK